jgi:hypothetical protein
MEGKLLALKLFLDALSVPAEIATVEDRKKVQKAVYLGQLTGVDLGYRFGWYLMGPYSPSLTRDYYQLSEELETEGSDYDGKQLRAPMRTKLSRITSLLLTPSGVPLHQADWLELVASYDYLRRVSGYSHEKAVDVLNSQKPGLVAFVDRARDALSDHGLAM